MISKTSSRIRDILKLLNFKILELSARVARSRQACLPALPATSSNCFCFDRASEFNSDCNGTSTPSNCKNMSL